jgi:hypothetical protein
MKASLVVVTLALVLVMLAGCAPGPNELAGTNAVKPAGFWLGLWHGIIAPVTFVISLFNKDVQMYEVHNMGGWYNLGFLLGMSIILGGGGASARRSRRRG